MAVTQIIDTLDISKGWLEVTNGSGNHGAYIIAIKGSNVESSACPISDLKYIVVEIGIPSGIKDKPITIQSIRLNFEDITSFDDANLNANTAYAKIGVVPASIFVRPIAYSDGVKEYKTGSMPVSINVLPF